MSSAHGEWRIAVYSSSEWGMNGAISTHLVMVTEREMVPVKSSNPSMRHWRVWSQGRLREESAEEDRR